MWRSRPPRRRASKRELREQIVHLEAANAYLVRKLAEAHGQRESGITELDRKRAQREG